VATEFTFDFTDLDNLSRDLNRGPTEAKITLNDGLREIGRVIVPFEGTGPLATATPKRSGKLAASTFFQITGGVDAQTLTVYQPAQSAYGAYYGLFVREGTAAHVIRPRKARVLRFTLPDGSVVFARVVHHPGTKPNPYHVRTLNALRPQIEAVVRKMEARIVGIV